MKKVFLSAALFFSLACSAQDYRLLNSAEKKLDEKEYDKALKILNKAEKGDYGFCGSAKVDAQNRINTLKLRLFKESKNDEALREFLNGLEPAEEFATNIFSIERINLALKTYSKEELNLKILDALKQLDKDSIDPVNDFDCVTLSLDSTYPLRLRFEKIWNIMNLQGKAFIEGIIKLYTESDYYKLVNNQIPLYLIKN